MRELSTGQTRPDISLCDEESHVRNGAPPWIPLLCQQTRGTVWLKRHDRMIDRAGPFIKPCAFCAPQAALGLDSLSCPVGRVCRVINAALLPQPPGSRTFLDGVQKVLDKGRLIDGFPGQTRECTPLICG